MTSARAFRWALLGAVAVAVLFLVPTQLVPALGSSAAPAPIPAAGGNHAIASAHVRPALTCPNPPLAYGPVNGHFPPSPAQYGQTCPGPIAQDMIHGTFSSNRPGSGERWKEAVYLPTAGSPGQSFAYDSFSLDMVVGGDAGSFLKQSLAQLAFTPVQTAVNSSVTWTISLDVWAMHNASAGGNCSTSSMAFIWNSSVWCIDDMYNNGSGYSGPSGVAGGTWYNVTFDGVRNAAGGMWVWANDSTSPVSANNATVHLNATNTGGFAYEPYYNSSCVDTCFLNWSYPFGLGIGWDICPIAPLLFAACDSYNQTIWDAVPTVQFGIPEYWDSATSSYSGDYQVFAPMSASAECSSSAIVAVATCNDYNSGGGTGFYPYFSWNGSLLNFGDNQPWTVENFGGEYTEYIQNGPYQHDFTPTFVDKVLNSSRAGYIRPASPLNVSAFVSDLGHVTSVNLTYTSNGSVPTTIGMSLIGGDSQRGVYNATVPTGPNGWINYTITVVTPAPNTVVSSLYHVFRGPLPRFQVTVDTVPAGCTNATVNGTAAPNGTVLTLFPGVYTITSTACYPHDFGRYATSPGLRVTLSSGPAGNLSVSSSGTVTAVWTYFRPHVTLNYATAPSTTCGSVAINGTPVAAGGSISLQFGIPVALGAPSGCAGVSFAGWTVVGNITVVGTTITAGGNGTLTGNYVSSLTSSSLTFYTNPSTCGAVVYRGAGYTNGESLQVDGNAYPISSIACAHWGFSNFTTTGGASIANGNLTVTSSGSVTENDYVLTEVTLLTFPPKCTITFDGLVYGNGSVIVVTNHTSHLVTQNACPGYYVFGFSTLQNSGLQLFGDVLTVNNSGPLYATWLPGSAPSSFLEFETDPGDCGAIQFQSLLWYNTNYTQVAPNTSGPISAHACANYGFVRWQASGGVQIHNGYAWVNSSGSIDAVFRPTATVDVVTNPTGCGTVTINGVSYTNNGTALLTEDVAYPINETPCAHYSFLSWGNTIGAVVVNGTMYLTSNAILDANYVPTEYNVSVVVAPSACGAIYVNGASQTNGSVVALPYGNYSIRPVPCVGDVVESVVGSANLTVAGNHLTVNGNGTLTATYTPIPPSVSLSVASTAFLGDEVYFTATVAVPVPPFTYNYTWTFGDGSTVTTPANFTQHAYSSTGNYHVSVVVRDPYGRVVQENATISVTPGSGVGAFSLPTSTVIVLGLAATAAVALIAAALWSRRPRAPAPDDAAPSYAPAESGDAAAGTTETPPSDEQAEQG